MRSRNRAVTVICRRTRKPYRRHRATNPFLRRNRMAGIAVCDLRLSDDLPRRVRGRAVARGVVDISATRVRSASCCSIPRLPIVSACLGERISSWWHRCSKVVLAYFDWISYTIN